MVWGQGRLIFGTLVCPQSLPAPRSSIVMADCRSIKDRGNKLTVSFRILIPNTYSWVFGFQPERKADQPGRMVGRDSESHSAKGGRQLNICNFLSGDSQIKPCYNSFFPHYMYSTMTHGLKNAGWVRRVAVVLCNCRSCKELMGRLAQPGISLFFAQSSAGLLRGFYIFFKLGVSLMGRCFADMQLPAQVFYRQNYTL